MTPPPPLRPHSALLNALPTPPPLPPFLTAPYTHTLQPPPPQKKHAHTLQVRFGVLNAGNFGVPQSRKRTIIWAARPGETLPEWPTPTHVFHSPQLTINLPGGVAYTAVPQMPGAPLRSVTVRDAILDLPAIENGHSQ